MTQRKTSTRTAPRPPSSASIAENGELKDTPANRALHPRVAPPGALRRKRLQDSAYYSDATSLIYNGDVVDTLRFLLEAGVKVDCIVTSPPYYGQRDYGVDGQLGLEDHPAKYIQNLTEVFNLCGELLSDTGSMWINIGDTYWSGKGAHKSREAKQSARRFGVRPQDLPGDGIWTKPKQLLLIPHRLAISLQDSGWLVRNDNVWVKPNPVPDQVRDRCSISHEYVFHLTKSRWYYFDQSEVGRETPTGKRLPPLDTWQVRPSVGDSTHRASFSEELVRLPIMSTTPPGGIVLDPFNGSGTTMAFSKRHGIRSIGIDLSEEYCQDAAARLRDITKRNG